MNALASALAIACVGLACAASFSEPRVPRDPFAQHYVPDSSEHDMRLEGQGRDCIAIAVLRGAVGTGWDERAAIAQTVANLVVATESVDACSVLPLLFDGVPHMPGPHELIEWQQALAVTDAVMLGDYIVSPSHCAIATHFTRAEAPTRHEGSPPAPECRVGGLFFTRSASDMPGVPGEGIRK